MTDEQLQARMLELQQGMVELDGAGTLQKVKLAFNVMLKIVFILNELIARSSDAKTN